MPSNGLWTRTYRERHWQLIRRKACYTGLYCDILGVWRSWLRGSLLLLPHLQKDDGRIAAPLPRHVQVTTPFILRVQPGQQSHLAIEWAAAYCPGPIISVSEVGCTHQQLSVRVTDGWAQLQGVFGCFGVGSLALAWLDEAEQQLQQVTLQPASPLQVLRIECVVPSVDRAAYAALLLYRADGSLAGRLATAPIQAK